MPGARGVGLAESLAISSTSSEAGAGQEPLLLIAGLLTQSAAASQAPPGMEKGPINVGYPMATTTALPPGHSPRDDPGGRGRGWGIRDLAHAMPGPGCRTLSHGAAPALGTDRQPSPALPGASPLMPHAALQHKDKDLLRAECLVQNQGLTKYSQRLPHRQGHPAARAAKGKEQWGQADTGDPHDPSSTTELERSREKPLLSVMAGAGGLPMGSRRPQSAPRGRAMRHLH